MKNFINSIVYFLGLCVSIRTLWFIGTYIALIASSIDFQSLFFDSILLASALLSSYCLIVFLLTKLEKNRVSDAGARVFLFGWLFIFTAKIIFFLDLPFDRDAGLSSSFNFITYSSLSIQFIGSLLLVFGLIRAHKVKSFREGSLEEATLPDSKLESFFSTKNFFFATALFLVVAGVYLTYQLRDRLVVHKDTLFEFTNKDDKIVFIQPAGFRVSSPRNSYGGIYISVTLPKVNEGCATTYSSEKPNDALQHLMDFRTEPNIYINSLTASTSFAVERKDYLYKGDVNFGPNNFSHYVYHGIDTYILFGQTTRLEIKYQPFNCAWKGQEFESGVHKLLSTLDYREDSNRKVRRIIKDQ